MGDGAQPTVSVDQLPARSVWVTAVGGVLAILAHIALLDAAVETFWSGSRLRWLMSPALAAMALLSLWAWRPGGRLLHRFGPGGAATTALAILVAGLGVAAWLPGGDADGLRLFLQDTAAILAAAVGVSVLLAGYVLVDGARRLPARARAVVRATVAALALYAAASFVLGIVARTSFFDLFHGAAAWQRMPRWAQGPSVGALFLVPLALLAQVFRAVDYRRRGKRAMLAWQALVLVGMLAVALSAIVAHPGLPAGGTAIETVSVEPLSPADMAQLAGQMNPLFDQLEARDRALPRELFDPSAVLQKVGRAPEALFHYVRDQTYWVPYQGALRGAAGVLSDRLGSSLDRSLLLAELLRLAGHRVRLAHASLDEPAARGLLQTMRPVPPGVIGAMADRDQSTATAVEALAVRVESAAGLGAQPPLADHRSADAADHWWVQVQADGGWTDADPASPDATYGRPLFTAAETLEVDGAGRPVPLPPAFVHRVDIRVITERWAAGRLSENRVLQVTVQPLALRDSPVLLRHAALRRPGEKRDDSRLGVRTGLLARTEWVPVVTINGRNFVQHGFNASGDEISAPKLGKAAAIGQSAGGLIGGLGGGLAGDETGENSGSSSSVLTAEWLEYEIRAPGREPRVVRRELFDLVGPAARAAGVASMPRLTDDQRVSRACALLGGVESLMISSRLRAEWVLHLFYQSESTQRGTWQEAMIEPDAEKRRAKLATIAGPTALLAYAAGRHAVSPAFDSVYLDSVNIANQRLFFALGGNGEVTARRVIDVVANDVAAGAPTAAARARLRQGLADTAAERLALGDSRTALNAYTLFASPPPQGASLVVLRSQADGLQRLPFPPDVRARIAAELRAGYAVVLYDKPWKVEGTDRTGWWRIHPASGEAIGVVDDGTHGDTSEYGEVTEIVDIAETDFEATYVGVPKTQVCYRGGMTPLEFWGQSARDIAAQLGKAWNEETVTAILKAQIRVLRVGIH
jgi:hypothetical protein